MPITRQALQRLINNNRQERKYKRNLNELLQSALSSLSVDELRTIIKHAEKGTLDTIKSNNIKLALKEFEKIFKLYPGWQHE